MYSFKHIKGIASEEAMMAYLKNLQPINPKGPIAIVGGHYMLFYDKHEDCLKPLVYQDLTNEKHIEFAKLMAGDFPVRTFNYSVELIKHFRSKGINAGNVFIINDHKFQSMDFQPNILNLVKNRGGDLRSKYYRGKNAFPGSFQNLIEQQGFKNVRDVVFDNDDFDRNRGSILPRKTIFHSEQFLRRQFDRIRKKKFVNNKHFFFRQNGLTEELFFGDNHKEVCLTEHGSCGCSLEVMEFMFKLMENKLNTVILFIPSECINQVNNGIELSLKFIKEVVEKDVEAIVVTGIGGGMHREEYDKLNIFEHRYKLSQSKAFENV